MSTSQEILPPLSKTARTGLKRGRKRGTFNRELVYSILDEAIVAHVGVLQSDGSPVVIPMAFARQGDHLLLHGSISSRVLKALRDQPSVCVTVTLLDGIVCARSAFHHSLNYRSVVLMGKCEAVTDAAEVNKCVKALTSQLVHPDRVSEIRAPNDVELKSTAFLRLYIDEGSCKSRAGPVEDDREDYETFRETCWAGVIQTRTHYTPVKDADCNAPLPAYLTPYDRSTNGSTQVRV